MEATPVFDSASGPSDASSFHGDASDKVDVEVAETKDEPVHEATDAIQAHPTDETERPETARAEFDERSWSDGNTWLTVWDEVAVRCCPRCLRSDGSQDDLCAHGGLVDLSVGALLIVMVAVKTTFFGCLGCCFLELAMLLGALACRVPHTFEALPLPPPMAAVASAPFLLQTLQLLFGLLQLVTVFFAWLLSLLQVCFMFLGGTSMLFAVITREVFAALGLLLCGLLALSPGQGWQMHMRIRKVAQVTHSTLCSGVRHCIVEAEEALLHLGRHVRVKIQTAFQHCHSARTHSGDSAAADAMESGSPVRTCGNSVRERVQNVATSCSIVMGTWFQSYTSGEALESTSMETAVASEAPQNSFNSAPNTQVEEQEAIQLAKRVRGWASKATDVLRSMFARVDEAMAQHDVVQPESATSDHARPLLIGEADDCGTASLTATGDAVSHIAQTGTALQLDRDAIGQDVSLANPTMDLDWQQVGPLEAPTNGELAAFYETEAVGSNCREAVDVAVGAMG